MPLRETINRNAGVVVAVIAIAAAFALFLGLAQSRKQAVGNLPSIQWRSFYTTDDGATWFVDDVRKAPPFEHDGKEAVRAYLYTFDGGKTKWVHYLEKYKDEEARQQAEEAARGGRSLPTSDNLLIKRPGDAEWVHYGSPKASAILTTSRPDGMPGLIEPVMP